jgi:glycine amidinotransferase
VPRQNTSACPRDLLLTLGNEVIEATMSWRSRFFEYRPYRGVLNEYYKRDPCMLWTCAPKPLMADSLYRHDYPQDYGEENKRLVREHVYLTSEMEPVFDAADVMRFGKDVFVHMGFTTNNGGFEWLRRHCASRGMRAHQLHFPDDLCPFHCDATFVPLRPYLAMENPSRPMEPSERKIFEEVCDVCLELAGLLAAPVLCSRQRGSCGPSLSWWSQRLHASVRMFARSESLAMETST